MPQVNEVEREVNAGIAPYSASYKRILIKTILEDAAGSGQLVRAFHVQCGILDRRLTISQT